MLHVALSGDAQCDCVLNFYQHANFSRNWPIHSKGTHVKYHSFMTFLEHCLQNACVFVPSEPPARDTNFRRISLK